MIDLYFLYNVATTPVQASTNLPVVSCNNITTVPLVCSKRKVVIKDQPTKYYLTLSNGRGEFEVNKCTWLASKLYGYYVVEIDGKWCNDEP